MSRKWTALVVGAILLWWWFRKSEDAAKPQVKVTVTDLSPEDLLNIDDNGVATGDVVADQATP